MNTKLKYIDITDKLYSQAKQIRITCFFEGMNNAEELINDEFEKNSFHVVCVNEKQKVIGTGRVHITESTGVISQMAVRKENQKSGIGQKILNELLLKCKKNGVKKIELSARETALDFYLKTGFKVCGNKYPSIKTKIIHQKMSIDINNVG